MEPENKLEQMDGVTGSVISSEGIGARLHAAREKAGLSIQDVAERTRVPARHLVALEEGRFQDLPALAYSTGFARSFALAVGLNGNEIAAQYRAEANPDPLPNYELHEPLDPARVPSSGLAWIAAAAGAVIVAVLIAFSMGVFSSAGTDEVASLEQPPAPVQIPPAEDGVESAADAAAPAAAPTPSPAPAPATGPVVLTAGEDAWIKVYDRAGQTVRMGILKAGESYSVPGDPNQLLLWTGKAGAIKITVGGRSVAPLGAPVQTVRDVSLAPDSLLARPAADAAAGTPPPAAAVPTQSSGR